MGYHSEVAIKCEKKAYEMLKEICQSVNCMPDKIFKNESEYILYWDWIRWDECYEDIGAIDQVMCNLEDHGNEDGEYGYAFIRLGESDGDIEIRSNDENMELYMIRKIDIPNDFKEVNVVGDKSYKCTSLLRKKTKIYTRMI